MKAARVSQPRISMLMTSASNAHTMVTVTGLAVAGLLYLAIPGALAAASVGELSPAVAPFWAAAFIVGGCMSFLGILLRQPRLEVVGLGLLGAALMLATSAIIDVRRPAVWPTGAIFLTHGLAAVGRMGAIVHIESTRARVSREARAAVADS